MPDRILPPMTINASAIKLREFMSELSEESYCAGWMEGTEYSLWEAMLRGGGRGLWAVSRNDAFRLETLAFLAGGWWYWPEKTGELLSPEPLFTGLRHWQDEYERYVAWDVQFRRKLRRMSG